MTSTYYFLQLDLAAFFAGAFGAAFVVVFLAVAATGFLTVFPAALGFAVDLTVALAIT